jgi:hypothetical protein
MKLCSGRWRVALGLGAALAVVAGFTPSVRAADGPRPLFPWRKAPAVKSIPQAIPKGDYVVLPEPLTLAEEDSPLSDVTQTEPQRPPASSTGQPSQVPSPPPPLNRPAPTTAPVTPAPGVPTDTLTPVPGAIGEVLGGPIYYGEPAPGDPYPLQYRERPNGNRKAKAEIISHNRSSEHAWYKEWRCRYYGYYPTQWRPFPDGWHLGRNIPPAPYVHPYDLKQPDPDPDQKRPPTPRSLREQEKTRDEDRAAPGREPAPPLRKTPTDTKSAPQKSGT